MAEEQEDPITIFVCGKKCDHSWDGPIVTIEHQGAETVTCSKCGALAIDVSLMEGP